MAERKLTVGINVDSQDALIKSLGVRIRIYKSTLCPNMKSLESMDHDLNCKLCNNNMIDFDCYETIAMFQQQDLVEQFKVQGTFHINEVLVSFLSGVTLQTFSKIELLDFQEDFYELIQRQEGSAIDVLKYSACDVLGLFVTKLVGPNKEIVKYHKETDFIIDVNGNVKWIGLNKPSDKQIYSIYYKYKPVFRAIKAVHRDRFSQFNLRPDTIKAPKVTIGGNTYVKLPETWVVQRDFLVERRDRNGNPISPNELYDPNA